MSLYRLTMLLKQCSKRHSILIHEKESDVAVHHLLKSRFFPVFNNCLKAAEHIFRHGQFPCSGIRLCVINHILHFCSSEQLMVDINDPVLRINVLKCQPAEFRNSHSRMEQDVDHLIILAVHVIIMDGFQELPHLLFGNLLS